MNTLKHKTTITQKGLKGILDDQKKTVELYVPYTYEELLRINKIKMKKLKVKQLINVYEDMLEELETVIELYKELYNKTEYYEEKSILDFNYREWNEIRKANGKLTKYYNSLKKVFQKIIEEEENAR